MDDDSRLIDRGWDALPEYSDKSGNADANIALAKKRAQAVRDELVGVGVEARRIHLVAPVQVTGTGNDDQARRVDLSVVQ